jgi:hypothetical protein
MPSRQADLDQKSVRRKNQNKQSFPGHSADRAVWAANNWNNLNGAAAPGQLRFDMGWGQVRASRLSTAWLPQCSHALGLVRKP